MKEKKLLWLLTSRGFGSEINNLLYAINYSEKKNYDLILESIFWNFSFEKDWTDYFLVTKYSFSFSIRVIILKYLLFYSQRFVNISKFIFEYRADSLPIRKMVLKLFINLIRGKEVETIFNNFNKVRKFNYCERLENDDGFLISMNRILKRIWKIKPEILELVEKKKIKFRGDYAAFHIRRGDKISKGEDEFYPVEKYMNKFKSMQSNIKNIFILGDDYKVYLELKEKFPKYKFLTLIPDNKNGYRNFDFNKKKKYQKKSEFINLLTDIEIAKESEIFVGSRKSNVFRLIEYLKVNKCYNVSDEKDLSIGSLI